MQETQSKHFTSITTIGTLSEKMMCIVINFSSCFKHHLYILNTQSIFPYARLVFHLKFLQEIIM